MNLPEDTKEILDSLKGGSSASYAIRFAAGFEDMMMVLSGMSNILIAYYSQKSENYRSCRW